LFRSKSIHNFQWSLFHSLLEGLERDLQTSMISNILTQSQTTVCMYTRSDFNIIKEVYHYLRTFIELFSIFFRPPIFQISFFVILTSLIVKTMGHFMTNDYSDSSIIGSIVSIHIKERRLQNSCWETDFISGWIIISINSLRSHQPFILIYRLSGFRNHFVEIPQIGTFDVRPIRIIFYLQCRVILPFVWITDLYMESSQFIQCFLFGWFAHPFQFLDTFTQRSL